MNPILHPLKLVFVCCLLLAVNAAMAQNLALSKEVANITTNSNGTLAQQNEILEYTITVKNISAWLLDGVKLSDNIPAGSAYVTGSTKLNGVAVADVSGAMPFSGTGKAISNPGNMTGYLAEGSIATVKFRVRVTANGGNITNYAVVEYMKNFVPGIESTNSVFTNLSPDSECSTIYEFTANSEGGVPSDNPYRYLRTINTSNGTSGSQLFGSNRAYDVFTGDDMGKQSGLSSSAAMAYDKNTNRMYFVNNSSSTAHDLCYIDMSASPMVAYRFKDYPLETTTGSGYNINRMSFASDGYGYAITQNGMDIIRFSVPTTPAKSPPVITRLGSLLNDASNGAKDILAESGGDIFGDGSGNLYLIANSGALYKINPNTRITTYLGIIDPLPSGGTSNSIAVDAAGNVYVGGGYRYVYKVDLATMQLTQINSNTINVWTSGDYSSCAFPVLAPALTAKKTYKNINPYRIGVIIGDTVEYQIEVTNTGNINAAGVKLYDGIPTFTNYIPGSTKLNGLSIADIGGMMPYAVAGGNYIYSAGQQAGIVRPGGSNKVILTFQASTSISQEVCNQSRITLMDANGNSIFINTTDPNTNGSQQPTCFDAFGTLEESRLSFSGKMINENPRLEWRLTTGTLPAKYELESSSDGTRFNRIAAVPVNPDLNSARVNVYTDPEQLFSDQRFYRLKLLYASGKYSYSGLVRVTRAEKNTAHLYPNPFDRKLVIDFDKAVSGNLEINLRDMSGRTVFSKTEIVNRNRLSITVNTPPELIPGMYFLEVTRNGTAVLRTRVVRK